MANRYLLARAALSLSLFSALLGSTAPSPLYPIYIAQLGLDASMATAIFAIYALGTLGALFLAPKLMMRLRDQRSLVISGLALTAAGAIVFAASHSVVMMLLGRLLCGAGTGFVTGMASAALFELAPARGKKLAATIATLAFTGGAAGGPLITSAALSADLAPLITPFVCIAVMALLSFLGLLVAKWPEPGRTALVEDGDTGPAPAAVPAGAGPALGPSVALFRLACLGVATAWMIGSILMAAGANLGLHLFDLHSASVAGLIPALFQLFAGIGQALFGRLHTLRAILLGVIGIVLVQVILLFASFGAHGAVLMAMMPIYGLFYGAAFVGALGLANIAAEPDQRGRYISGFYTVGYLSNAIPSLGFGILIDKLGMAAAFYALSAVLIALAIIAGAMALTYLRGRVPGLQTQIQGAAGL